jgi:uncharacterized protein YbjT (DUF2867 family)
MLQVFLTGATGYIGRPLAAELLRRGHEVRALARRGSAHRLPPGCTVVLGDGLDRATYAAQVGPADCFVHLIGVSRPSPAKAEQFRRVDLASAREAVAAAAAAAVGHFVYVSVAHPAPVMKAYTAARAEAEVTIRGSGLNATMLRPWYVLGPGHRWPVLFLPLYWLAGLAPLTRDGARRLGLVTLAQMVGILVWSVEHPAEGVRVLAVPEIRRGALGPSIEEGR